MTEAALPETAPTQTAPTQTAPTDRRMLEARVCPVTMAVRTNDTARAELISRAAHLAFPIRDGIPIMLVSEARTID